MLMTNYNHAYARVGPIIDKLNKRRRYVHRLMVVAVTASVALILATIVGMGAALLQGDMGIITRLEVPSALFDTFSLSLPDSHDQLRSATVYLGHSHVLAALLSGWLYQALAVPAGIYLAISLLKQSISSPLLIMVKRGLIVWLMIQAGVTFLPMTLYQMTAQSITLPNVLSDSPVLQPDSLDYPALTQILAVADTDFASRQYVKAQYALIADTQDASVEAQAFLSNRPGQEGEYGLGFHPLPQNLYALEMAAYGEARSESAQHYTATQDADVIGVTLSTSWIGMTVLISTLSLGLALVSFFLQHRIRRLSRLAQTLVPKQ